MAFLLTTNCKIEHLMDPVDVTDFGLREARWKPDGSLAE